MTLTLGQSATPRLTIRRPAGLLRQEPAAPRLTVNSRSQTLVVRMPGRGPAGPPGPAGPVLAQRVLLDDLSPQFNGSTQSFTLTASGNPYPVDDPLSLEVIIGGIQQRPGPDYSVSGAVITFTFSPRVGLTSLIIGTSYQRNSEGLPPGGTSGQVLTKTGPGAQDLIWATPASTSRSYTHTQATASAEWLINHNLGYRPSVELLTSGGLEFDADVVHLSVNTVRVYLNAAITGIARLV